MVARAQQACARHILHQHRSIVVCKDGSVQLMPHVTMLSALGHHSDVTLRCLKQLPSLLREMMQLRLLCVDVKASNFAVFGDTLVAVDCDGMVQYSDADNIPGPFTCTKGHGAAEVEAGQPIVTLQSDVQAFAKLINDLVSVTKLSPRAQAVLKRALQLQPRDRPPMEEFISELSASL